MKNKRNFNGERKLTRTAASLRLAVEVVKSGNQGTIQKSAHAIRTLAEVAELFRCHEQHVRNMKSKGKFREDRHYINFGGKVLFVKENLCKDFGLWANARRY